MIRSIGRRILKGLPERDGWAETNEELRRYLGEGDSCAAVWKKLRGYQARKKCFGEIASEVRELAVKVADEEDVRVRLGVKAFLGAIPLHFAKEIRMKKIENLEEALEEAKTRRAIEEEEGRKKKVHAAAEEGGVARQGQNMDPSRERRPRGDPIYWGCGERGHTLRECPLWQEFRKDMRRRREANVKRSEFAVMKEALN